MTTPSPYAERLAVIPSRRRTVEAGGVDTAYWEYGAEDAEVTILSVHGFRGDHHGLEPVVAQMPGVRWIMPDLPGFGETGRMAVPHDLDAFTGWLCEFAAAVAPGAIVLGHSFGSIVASAAVAGGLDTPRLILVNPIGAPALEGPRGVLTRLAVLYYRAAALLPARMGTWLLRSRIIVRVMSLVMVKTRDRELRRWIHEEHDRFFSGFSDRASLHEAFVTSVSHDVRSFAPSIRQPVLLVAAELDDITPIAKERELQKLFPDARLVEIGGVGHLIHYETPAAAADAIRQILERDAADEH